MTRRTAVASISAAAVGAENYRIIDPHVHVWKHDPKFPFAEGCPRSREAAPEDMLLELMKANGVAKTVIIQVIHYKYDNSYLADVLKRYPGHVPWSRAGGPARIPALPIISRSSSRSRAFAACAQSRRECRRATGSKGRSCRRYGSAAKSSKCR